MNLTGKRVLVTGGAGFIGSNLARALIDAGASVVILDDLFTGTLDNLAGCGRHDFVHGSVCDYDTVAPLVRRADFVAHLAARNIIASTANPRDDCESNVVGTLNVLLAARENPGARLVYASSASIYGNPRRLPIPEDETPLTFSPYAVSKLAGENYCVAFYETYGVAACAVRYSNVYGVNQRPGNPYCGVVSRFIRSIGRGEPATIHGDGLQSRDFTYVDDAVEATILAMTSGKAEGMVFNVGSGIETSVLRLAEEIASAMQRKLTVTHVDRRDVDNIRRRVLNIELARSRLRWAPRITLREGLRRTIDWWHREAGRASGPAT
jgi:UDP-glucose 4-epimerase